GLDFGDSANQGAVVGNSFIHPVLKFTFSVPGRFSLQNSSNAVVGTAGQNEAVRFDSAEVPQSMVLTDYLKSGWIAGLKPETVSGGRTANGVEMARGDAATGQWIFHINVLRYEGAVYRFIFAARSDSAAFRTGAQQTVDSFRAAQ